MQVNLNTPIFQGDFNIYTDEYADGTQALGVVWPDGESEIISTNLGGYGLTPRPGAVWIKDYSEGVGLAKALEEAGVGAIVGRVTFGPFNTTASEFQVF